MGRTSPDSLCFQYGTASAKHNTININTSTNTKIALLCHTMPCHAMPCHAMPCHAMPCHAMVCHACMHACMPQCCVCDRVHVRLSCLGGHFVQSPLPELMG